MAMSNRSLSPLQRALQKSRTQETAMQPQGVTPLSGIEYYKNGLNERMRIGDPAAGGLNMPAHATMGTQFGSGTDNPWEALLSHRESTEDMDQYTSQMPNNNRVMNVKGFSL